MTDPDLKLRAQNLISLSKAQRMSLGDLRVSERQEFWGGSFTESLDVWEAGPSDQVFGLFFLLAALPIGMTLFKRPPLSPDWAPADTATIHGLKIATPWQRQGWGHKAFDLAIEHLRKEWPTTLNLMLAVDADNASALAVYRAHGMTDNGAIFSGNHGPEHRLALPL